VQEGGGDDLVAGLIAGAAGGSALALLLSPWAPPRADDALRVGFHEALSLTGRSLNGALARLLATLDDAIREGTATARRRREELTAAYHIGESGGYQSPGA
jgi:hypothetical protein